MKAGLWRHYKGPLYLLLGVAHDANAEDLCARDAVDLTCGDAPTLDEREVVVYVPLMLDGAHLGPRMAVRTRSDWERLVCGSPECKRFGVEVPDGVETWTSPGYDEPWAREVKACAADHSVLRFTYVGEHLTADLLP